MVNRLAAAAKLCPFGSGMYTPLVMQVFAILPAAGLGTRMAASQPKQFLELNGLPILIHSLRAFAAVPRVTAIYVAVRSNEIERVKSQIEDHAAECGFAGRVRVVEGGDNRQESVAHALSALDCEPEDIVLVHDAVRPLIDTATIERTIDAVAQYGAAIVGLPAVDTVKQVERTAHSADAAGLPFRPLAARRRRSHCGRFCGHRRSLRGRARRTSHRRCTRLSG
jgi:2-C-methyl-D-erythritol 4-phosphate cytidylyltransferase